MAQALIANSIDRRNVLTIRNFSFLIFYVQKPVSQKQKTLKAKKQGDCTSQCKSWNFLAILKQYLFQTDFTPYWQKLLCLELF